MKQTGRIAGALLAPVLLGIMLCPQSIQASDAPDARLPRAAGRPLTAVSESYRTVAAAGGRELLLQNSKELLSVAVRDTATGEIWRTTPEEWNQNNSTPRLKQMEIGSQLQVSYVDSKTMRTALANSLTASHMQGGASVFELENGIRIVYDFPREKELFTVPVDFLLDDGGLRVEIDYEGIEEKGDTRILTISLLPFFGAGEADEDGYLLIPDGCGALIGFNTARKGMSPYKQPVYGRDPVLTMSRQSTVTQAVRLPVVGIKRENQSLLAMIDEGAEAAAVNASSSGMDTHYNNAYFEFTYRQADTVVMADKSWSAKDVTLLAARSNTPMRAAVEYRFLPAGSGFMEMAGVYRDILTAGVERSASAGLMLDVYGAVKVTTSFMGIVSEQPVAMTTFAQAGTMLRELQRAGAGSISIQYKGWMKGGLDDSPAVGAAAEGRLGGEKGLLSLAEFARKQDIALLPDVEFLKIYKGRPGWAAYRYASRSVSRAPAAQNIYKLSTYFPNVKMKPYYLMTPSLLARETGLFRSSYKKLGLDGLSAATLGSMVYADYSSSSFTSRSAAKAITRQVLQSLGSGVERLGVSGGNDYAVRAATDLYDVPLFDSGYELSATDIPFYQIVLHGVRRMGGPAYNQSENPELLFLRYMETGVNPSFSLTWENSSILAESRYNHLISTCYADWKDVMADRIQAFLAVHEPLAGQLITGYEALPGDLRAVTYEKGTTILVNYGKKEAEYRGRTVPPRDYLVIKEG